MGDIRRALDEGAMSRFQWAAVAVCVMLIMVARSGSFAGRFIAGVLGSTALIWMSFFLPPTATDGA